ncbi:MAG: 6-carboxytetrahydropterin synthase [Bdellovibrionales bacterium]|nr:6-carboxytetrahydropterin synthase [Bdellovibrionales bacterium]
MSARFHFEAAHFQPTGYSEGHPNRRMHGHSYEVEVIVRGPVDPKSGFVMDHGDLLAKLQPVEAMLDHYCLNDIPGLESPTGEVIARWIWRQLKPGLPLLSEIIVSRPLAGIRVYYSGEGEPA